MSKKSPQLRFKGFTDDWEERKLSDLFIKGGSGGTPKSTNKAFYDGDIPFLGISDITKSNGFINNTEKHISSDGLNSSAAWIVSKGAISLAMYASVGKLAILNIDAATSQAFYNMIFDDYDLRDLVYQRLNKANELSEWNKLISTGTQSNLNADKVKNFQMYLPKNHDEIKLISTFFKQIDNTITLHQRKLDLLKEQKKGFLQKMFPKNGAKVPELRFKGFADDWGLRKLGEVYNFQYGQFNNNPDNGGQYPIYGANGIIGGYDEYNSENAIVIGHMGAYAGHVLWAEGKHFVTYNGTMGIADKSILNSNFGYYLVVSVNVHKLTAGSGQPFVSYSDLNGIKILIPTIEEQQKIGSFFKQLDDTIALHQRKLDLLKEQKKGFLQKMFV